MRLLFRIYSPDVTTTSWHACWDLSSCQCNSSLHMMLASIVVGTDMA